MRPLLLLAALAPAPLLAQAPAAPARPLAVVEGLSGPEAVRYDPEQDVYFVANFNGSGGARDDNGFISRVRPDGRIEQLRFVAGGANGVVLHAPRGMTIQGDTLWVADVDAVRGFDRRSGAPLASVPFDGMDVGFLNDVAVSGDGVVHVTDTGRDRIYRLAGGRAEVALADSALGRPNGITWDAAAGHFVVVPYGGSGRLLAWTPGTTRLVPLADAGGGRYDGVEILADGRLLVASQADTSLRVVTARGTGTVVGPVVRTGGNPADIGVDTRRGRVAVPFIALNRVEIWAIPE